MTRCVAACVALLLWACVSTPANATSSLSFGGGGYWIDFEIGHVTRPVIASLRFNAPGDSKGVLLRGNFQVKTFDTKRRILRLIYTGEDTRVSPFTLVVVANKSTLTVNGKRINSRFSWEM